MKKKTLMLIAVSLFLIISISSVVYAQEKSTITDSLSKAGKILSVNFNKLDGDGGYAFKFILGVIIFLLMDYGLKKVFDDQPKMAAGIAVLFSLGTILLIPKGIALGLFKTYRTIFIVILAILPAGVGFYLKYAKFKDDTPGGDFWSGIIFILIAWSFGSAYETITSAGIEVGGLEFVLLLGPMVCYFIGFWYFFGMLKGGPGMGEKAGEAVRGAKDLPGAIKKGWKKTRTATNWVISEGASLTELENTIKQAFEPTTGAGVAIILPSPDDIKGRIRGNRLRNASRHILRINQRINSLVPAAQTLAKEASDKRIEIEDVITKIGTHSDRGLRGQLVDLIENDLVQDIEDGPTMANPPLATDVELKPWKELLLHSVDEAIKANNGLLVLLERLNDIEEELIAKQSS